jgi:hypothetical protein
MRRALQLILALPLLSCGLFQRATSLIDFLPRETEVPGWVAVHRTTANGRKAIERISGDYALYDPRILASADYHHLSDESKTVRVELLEFESSLDSFGLFSLERGFDFPVRYADDNAYFSDKGCFFRLGDFYIKITGENLGEERDGIFEQYRAVLFQNLKNHAGGEPLPNEMFLFSDNRSTIDLAYYKKGIQAVPGSENLYIVQRNMRKRKYKIFYMKKSTLNETGRAFRSILRSADGSYILSKIGNYETALRLLENHEYQYISYYKHWIFGALDAENMEAGASIVLSLFNEIKARAYALPNR